MTFILLLGIVFILLFGISLAKDNLETIQQINKNIIESNDYQREICRHLNNKS